MDPEWQTWCNSPNYHCLLFKHSINKLMQWVCNIFVSCAWTVAVRNVLSCYTWQTSFFESWTDLIICSHVMWHKVHTSWTWILFFCSIWRWWNNASSAVSVTVDTYIFHLLLLDRLFCILLLNLHASLFCMRRNFPVTMIPDFWN